MDQHNLNQYRQESRSEWPFFAFVTLVMIIVYGVVVAQTPALRADTQRIVFFTALMVIHAVLYWLPLLFPFNTSQGWVFLLFQAVLAYALIYIAGSSILTFGLVAPLIGLSLGMMPRAQAAIFIILLLATSTAFMVILEGWTSVSSWLFVALPVTLFVIIYVVLYSRQADARAKAQKLLVELEDAHAELAAYAEQVEELTLAAERQRLARELHDTLAQGVAGLILQLEAVAAHLDNGDMVRAQTIVKQAMERARGTLAEARRAIDDLRVKKDDARDLGQTLRDQANRFSLATQIPCHLDLDLHPSPPWTLHEPVMRMVTEALANVAQHARASEVWVTLQIHDGALVVEVKDDGVGFETAVPAEPGHYGLQGMQERAELAGGELAIFSHPSDGTTIRLRLPWETQPPSPSYA